MGAFFRQPVPKTIRLFVAIVSFWRDDANAASKSTAPIPTVKFYSAPNKPSVAVTVEVPQSPEAFEQGLMFRKSLAKNHGMLFVFDRSQPLAFWMHNTYLSLDMIFLDPQLRVVWVEENAPPLDDTPRGSLIPAQYVLEVVAGFAKAHHIHRGSQATLVAVPQVHIPMKDR